MYSSRPARFASPVNGSWIAAWWSCCISCRRSSMSSTWVRKCRGSPSSPRSRVVVARVHTGSPSTDTKRFSSEKLGVVPSNSSTAASTVLLRSSGWVVSRTEVSSRSLCERPSRSHIAWLTRTYCPSSVVRAIPMGLRSKACSKRPLSLRVRAVVQLGSTSASSCTLPVQPTVRPNSSTTLSAVPRTAVSVPSGRWIRKRRSNTASYCTAVHHAPTTSARSPGCTSVIQRSPSAASGGAPVNSHQRLLTVSTRPSGSLRNTAAGDRSRTAFRIAFSQRVRPSSTRVPSSQPWARWRTCRWKPDGGALRADVGAVRTRSAPNRSWPRSVHRSRRSRVLPRC